MSVVADSETPNSGALGVTAFPPNYGPFASEQEALSAVVDRLVQRLNPIRIYLFGSRARGHAAASSDFDLVLVLDDEPSLDIDHTQAYAPLLGLGIGCDVIPCGWSELQEILADPSNPWQQVLSSARVVHERRK